MKRSLATCIVMLWATQIFAAQDLMDKEEFLELQQTVNKDIERASPSSEMRVMDSLDRVAALQGKEPWKTEARLWAANAYKEAYKELYGVKQWGPQLDFFIALRAWAKRPTEVSFERIRKAIDAGADPNKTDGTDRSYSYWTQFTGLGWLISKRFPIEDIKQLTDHLNKLSALVKML